MILERLEVESMLSFLEPVIPSDVDGGKNCIFVRVEGSNLICTAGNEFSTKKVVLIGINAMEHSAKAKNKGALPKTFMIPRPEVVAFKKLMDEHKAHCKKMQKNDPSYMHVEITDNQLLSHDGGVPYTQPSHNFKNLEEFFQVKMGKITGLKVRSGVVESCMKGFNKSEDIEITFTGDQKPVHFLQGNFEAVMMPPVEKKKEEGDQTTIDGENE